MVTVRFNVQKKDLYLIGAIFVFLIGAGIVIATGSTPDINGHSYSEIQKCPAGQILKSDASGNWGCGTDNTGGSGTTGSCAYCATCGGTWPYARGEQAGPAGEGDAGDWGAWYTYGSGCSGTLLYRDVSYWKGLTHGYYLCCMA